MDALILQDAAVTLVAGGAVWVVIRRLFTVVKPTGGSKCASCPSAQAPAARQELTSEARPLTLVR